MLSQPDTLRPGLARDLSQKASSEHAEYPTLPKDIPDHELPCILPAEVARRDGKEDPALWLVIDEVVYDCTSFVDRHPGGDAVIKNFAGKDCSWQFHKIHNLQKTRNWLPYLRVGRTQGVQNLYPEPKSGFRKGF
ncbi:hypothetical protein ABEF95_008146 [Exophiala dermatitidis]